MNAITMKIHPASALSGVLAVLLVLGLASMTQQQLRRSQQIPLRVTVDGIPTPQQMVQIKEGQTFVVPPGKIFVLTALGTKFYPEGGPVALLVNDEIEVEFDGTAGSVTLGLAAWDYPSVKPVPPGFTVPAGSTIKAERGPGSGLSGRAWGYLVDA